MASYENVKGINIQIGGDTQPLFTALNEATKKTKEFEAQLTEVNRALKLRPTDLNQVQKKFEILGNVVSSAKAEVDILSKGLQSAKLKWENGEITEEQFREVERATEQAQKKLEYYQKQFEKFKEAEGKLININKELEKSDQEYQDLRNDFHKYSEELSNTDYQKDPEHWQQTREKIEQTREAMENNRNEHEKFQDEMNKVKREVNETSSAMDTYAEQTKKAGENTGDLGEEADTAEDKMGDLKDAIFEGGAGLKIFNEAMGLVKKGLEEGLKALQEYASEMNPWAQDLLDSVEADKKLIQSLKDQQRELKTSASQIDIQGKRIQELNRKILDNNKANKDSSKERTQLKLEVDKLNESLGYEAFHISEITGGLKESNAEFKENLENYRRRALIQYELNAYIESYAKYMDGLAELEQTNAYASNIANNSYQQKKTAVEELGKEFERHKKAYEELSEEEAEYVSKSEEGLNELVTGHDEAYTKMLDKLKEYRDKNAEYQDSILQKIRDTNKEINDESETSLEERLDTLKKNGQAILNYESNLAFLRTLQMQTMNGDQKQALDEFIRMLSDGSEESMQIVNLVVEDFKEKGGETAWEFINEFTREDIPGSVYDIGTQTITKFAQGMHDTKNKVQKVADEIASIVRKTFQKKFTIKEVHGGAGMYVTDMAQGGIITEPTYIRAGELGAEAILPLDKLAGIITSTMNNNGGAVGNYTMNVYPQSMSPSEQETLFEKFDARFGASTSRRNI